MNKECLTAGKHANIFVAMGFTPEEAQEQILVAERQVQAQRQLQSQMLTGIARWIKRKGLNRPQAANALGISAYRLGKLLKGDVTGYSMSGLTELLLRTGDQTAVTIQ